MSGPRSLQASAERTTTVLPPTMRRGRDLLKALPPMVLALGLLVSGVSTSQGAPRSLTLEQRIEAQRSLESVYWSHRIWPAANPGPRPSIDVLLPRAALRAKVEASLRESAALEHLYSRPIEAAELQAEIARMVRGTRAPTVLAELFAALGNDPFLIAECLARPLLADRLLRSWYAAAGDPGTGASPGLSADSGEEAFETWWRGAQGSLSSTIALPDPATLPGGAYTATTPAGAPCDDDAWTPTRYELPSPRSLHTAVWTGSEMIVWGGTGASGELNTGGRYDPATDVWTGTSTGGAAPSPRRQHTAVWTGTEMIVWGGTSASTLAMDSGARYDPLTDSWTPTGSTGAPPSARRLHTAVWTGSEMIVWGGRDFGNAFVNSGAGYDPVSDTWTATSTGADVPSPRRFHTAVWTGSEMIIWGGRDAGGAFLDSGGRYDPIADTWKATAAGANLPQARQGHTAVWTGNRMIVWGGSPDGGVTFLNTGGQYNVQSETWSPTSLGANVPPARQSHTAVWTGSEMIVWSGGSNQPNTGGRYNPVSNTWKVVPQAGPGVPSARTQFTAVWSGSAMIVWGGTGPAGPLNSGGRYAPAQNSWSPTSLGASVPAARDDHSALWTGSEMIVWGGSTASGATQTGGRYDPATDVWAPTAVDAATPAARRFHTGVWTGSEMIVWGGEGASGALATGGRYAPTTDQWTATSTGPGTPAARVGHTAIWTGAAMIVWGGSDDLQNPLGTGGRYAPGGDLWTATSTGPGAPTPRHGHTAIWTGTKMIVWGGETAPGAFTASGSRYDPASDSWSATAGGGDAPSARTEATAVWTGSAMLVWGGRSGAPLGSGAGYDPLADAWTTIGGASAPEARSGHSAVWTGSEMIVWGGDGAGPTLLGSGGRYAPLSDQWTGTSAGDSAPPARDRHTAVWSGSEMIVWGGFTGEVSGTGARYCAAPACEPGLWYRDADGDGYGTTFDSVDACAAPAGYVASAGDCDDADAGRHPGALDQTCNGLDEDCDGSVDEEFAPQATSCGIGACLRSGSTSCVGGVVHDSCVPGSPAPDDASCNGSDDDCDGSVDEEFAPQPTTCGIGACLRNGSTGCVGGAIVDGCVPGAPTVETCNGADDDCDGVTDNVLVPAAITSLLVEKLPFAAARLEWDPIPGAVVYDVVFGDVAALRDPPGGFQAATLVCVANDLTETFFEEPAPLVPSSSAGWYLVRGVNCLGAGTYDSGAPSQVGSRDPGIAASSNPCP